ncbi:T9SS type A sorting domain-containing protein [Chryseobacterium indoltheticum]|uniref:T9SS type A sorting domain-containing protein n=1 Tax=Chryseobacterium indoltheticum TaxID=254 RepID=UPI003F498F36
MRVYPNPASERIFVDGLKGSNNIAEIFSTEGRKVLDETKFDSENSINISGILQEFITSILNREILNLTARK